VHATLIMDVGHDLCHREKRVLEGNIVAVDEHERGTGELWAGVLSCEQSRGSRSALLSRLGSLRELVYPMELIAKISFLGRVEPPVHCNLAWRKIACTRYVSRWRHDISAAEVQLIARLVGKQ